MTRLIQLLMVGVLLFGAVGAWWYHREGSEKRAEGIEHVRLAIAELRKEIKYQGALGRTPVNGRGFPLTVDAGWWKGDPPVNILVPPENPWLEIAPIEDYTLEHPRTRVILSRNVAGLWYNPGNGLVRARVPQLVSDRDALKLYNALNGSALVSLFNTDAESVVRRPTPVPLNDDDEPDTGITFNRD